MTASAPSPPPPFAARIGDPITHDSAATAGAIGPVAGLPPTVFIEGLPAAVMGCTVPCSGATAAGPAHPAAPSTIIGGSSTVTIQRRAAVRCFAPTDRTTCGAQLGNPVPAERTTRIGG